jgi:hypothetical protein
MDARRQARRNWLIFGLVTAAIVGAFFVAYMAFIVSSSID